MRQLKKGGKNHLGLSRRRNRAPLSASTRRNGGAIQSIAMEGGTKLSFYLIGRNTISDSMKQGGGSKENSNSKPKKLRQG